MPAIRRTGSATTSSLVPKYRWNVRGAMSAAAQMSATVTLSYPRSMNRRQAASAVCARFCSRLRSRRPVI